MSYKNVHDLQEKSKKGVDTAENVRYNGES